MEPPMELLTPLHYAAYRLYALHIEGQGKQAQPWLAMTAGHQNILIQNLIDLINKQQRLDPPLTLQDAAQHPLPTKDHKAWQKREIAKWRRTHKPTQ